MDYNKPPLLPNWSWQRKNVQLVRKLHELSPTSDTVKFPLASSKVITQRVSVLLYIVCNLVLVKAISLPNNGIETHGCLQFTYLTFPNSYLRHRNGWVSLSNINYSYSRLLKSKLVIPCSRRWWRSGENKGKLKYREEILAIDENLANLKLTVDVGCLRMQLTIRSLENGCSSH